MTTKDMEQAVYWFLAKTGTYLCFEVMIPVHLPAISHYDRFGNSYMYKRDTRERVDLLTYEKRGGIWRFYELKLTVSDFRSKCKKSFYGNYNYFVMPEDVYEKVKEEIPEHIGVICCVEQSYSSILKGVTCRCVKKPKKQELGVNEEELKFNFMQSLSLKQQHLMEYKLKEMIEIERKKTSKRRTLRKKHDDKGNTETLFESDD